MRRSGRIFHQPNFLGSESIWGILGYALPIKIDEHGKASRLESLRLESGKALVSKDFQ
jgi:hypothetical protein